MKVETNVDLKKVSFTWEHVENLGDCIRLSSGELLTPRGIADDGGEWYYSQEFEIGFFD